MYQGSQRGRPLDDANASGNVSTKFGTGKPTAATSAMASSSMATANQHRSTAYSAALLPGRKPG